MREMLASQGVSIREKEKCAFGFSGPRMASSSPEPRGRVSENLSICPSPNQKASSSSKRDSKDFRQRLAKSIETHKARTGYNSNPPPGPGKVYI